MKKIPTSGVLGATFLIFSGVLGQVRAQPATNLPPRVSIVWPPSPTAFGADSVIKIKADATDPDGAITEVRFYADTNLIGVATAPPYDIVWRLGVRPPRVSRVIKAVATDNRGATSESSPVTVLGLTGAPGRPVLRITSPEDGDLLAAPATFEFSAELLASSSGGTGPTDFYVGTNLVGSINQTELFTLATPPYSIIVGNLGEGKYTLRAQNMGENWPNCGCQPITISVVKLGVQKEKLKSNGQLEFEVVTSYQGKPTIIQGSSDLVTWFGVSTNVPSSNTFTASLQPGSPTSFYRVVVPP